MHPQGDDHDREKEISVSETQYASPFEKYKATAWPYWYRAEVIVDQICGGVPQDDKTAESWIRAKLKDTRSEPEVQALVAQTREELRITREQAGREAADTASIAGEEDVTEPDAEPLTEQELLDEAVAAAAREMAGLNVFKRTEHGILYIEGRQVKAALKEATSVAANAGKITTKGWGSPDNASYKKAIKGWFPEHVFVPETVVELRRKDGQPVTREDGILQKFVHTHRGDAIGYEEYVNDALLRFTVKTDVEMKEKDWAMIWLTGQDQGLGASRSQGFGTYQIVLWEPIPAEIAVRGQHKPPQ
jgi:hypothetical protein